MSTESTVLEIEDLPELFGDDDFAVGEASRAAIAELKIAGIRIFYHDLITQFEIRYTTENADFEVVRELL